MASAQQKPKNDKGVRNSSRRNGKLSKQSVVAIPEIVSETDPDDQGRTKQTVSYKKVTRYGPHAQKLTGKGKPTFNSCLGVSVARLSARAVQNETTLLLEVKELYKLRAERDFTRAAQRGLVGSHSRDPFFAYYEKKAEKWLNAYYANEASKHLGYRIPAEVSA